MTLEISGQPPARNPGNVAPAVAYAVADNLDGHANPANSAAARNGHQNAEAFRDQGARMEEDGNTDWWDLIPSSAGSNDEMDYACDSDLGSPAEVDCTQIEWNQLSPVSDNLAVAPGAPTFLHSNTCFLAISSSTKQVLSWAQIRTAVSALINACVQPPYGSSQGGRAYYRAPPEHGSKRRKARKRDDTLTGKPESMAHTMKPLFSEEREKSQSNYLLSIFLALF